MIWKLRAVSGRRETVYSIDAETKEHAIELYAKYLSFLGVVATSPIEAEEVQDEPGV